MATILQLPRRKAEQEKIRARILDLWHHGVARTVIVERLATTIDTVNHTIQAARADGVRRGDSLPAAPEPRVVEAPKAPLLRSLPADWAKDDDAKLIRTGGKYSEIAKFSAARGIESRVLVARELKLRGAR